MRHHYETDSWRVQNCGNRLVTTLLQISYEFYAVEIDPINFAICMGIVNDYCRKLTNKICITIWFKQIILVLFLRHWMALQRLHVSGWLLQCHAIWWSCYEYQALQAVWSFVIVLRFIKSVHVTVKMSLLTSQLPCIIFILWINMDYSNWGLPGHHCCQ